MTDYCCETFRGQVEWQCNKPEYHPDKRCGDQLIAQFKYSYGIIYHADVGADYLAISFCPFCGAKLLLEEFFSG